MLIFRKVSMKLCPSELGRIFKIYYNDQSQEWEEQEIDSGQIGDALIELKVAFPDSGYEWQNGILENEFVWDRVAIPS